MYAKLKNGKVVEVVKDYVSNAIKCNKPIYINGIRSVGRIPKVGYVWHGDKFTDK